MNPLAFQTVCSGMAVAVVRHDPKDLLDSGLLHGAKCFDGQDLRTVVKAAVDTMSYPLSPSGAGIPGDTEEDFWGFCKKRSQKKPFFIRHSLSITEQTPGAFGYKFYTLEAPLSGDKALLAYHPETGKYYPVTVADGRVSIAFDSQKNTFADILEMLAPSSTHVGIKLDDKELMTAFIESIAVESKPVKAQFREKKFVPLTVLYSDKDNVNKLMAKAVEELPRDLKICHNSEESTLSFGYGKSTIKALVGRSEALNLLTGTGKKSLFEGYTRVGIPVYFRSLMLRNPFTSAFIESFTFPNKPREIPFSHTAHEELIREWLQLYPGICLGENHLDLSPKEFLCRHLKTMVDCGVTTLYMEHLMVEELQDEVDEYLSCHAAELPTALAAYLDRLSQGNLISQGQCGFKEVMIAAKAAGIKRIFCIDSTYSYLASESDGYLKGVISTRQRCLDLHSQAAKVFSSTRDGGKFLFYVGGAHLNTYKDIPGLGTITGALNLYIKDSDKDAVEPNGIYTIQEKQKSYTFDVFMQVNKPPNKI